MKTAALQIACLALALTSGLTIATKLWTYEYFFTDDPTSGIALRSVPSFENRGELGRSPSGARDRVLVADENGFVGEGFYRFIVRGGWLAPPILTLVCLAWWSHARRTERLDRCSLT